MAELEEASNNARKYLKTFGKWLQHLPVKQIVMILGNHERDYQIDSNTILPRTVPDIHFHEKLVVLCQLFI